MPYIAHEHVLLGLAAVALLIGGCQSAEQGPNAIEPAYSYHQEMPSLTHAEIWPVAPTSQRTAEWDGRWPTTQPTSLVPWLDRRTIQHQRFGLIPKEIVPSRE